MFYLVGSILIFISAIINSQVTYWIKLFNLGFRLKVPKGFLDMPIIYIIVDLILILCTFIYWIIFKDFSLLRDALNIAILIFIYYHSIIDGSKRAFAEAYKITIEIMSEKKIEDEIK